MICVEPFFNKKTLAVAPRKITEREIEVISLLADGFIVPEIAKQIFLSPKTVSKYLERLRIDFKLKNTAHIVAFGLRKGLIL